MKRILFPKLLFLAIILFFTNCSIFKIENYKPKGTYINTQSIKLMDANTRLYKLKNDSIQGNLGNRIQQDDDTVQQLNIQKTKEIQDLEDIISKLSDTDANSSSFLKHFDPSQNGCVMECCDIEPCASTEKTCPVYYIEQSCNYIISEFPITEGIIKDYITGDSITQTTGAFLELGDYSLYYVSLSVLELDKKYRLNISIINADGILEEYEVIIKVYQI